MNAQIDPCVVLWQAMNASEKVGNRTDDKLIVEFLRRAGYCIAPLAATPAPAELEKAHEARRQAQSELEYFKARLASARLTLMRELKEQGWVPAPAPLTDEQIDKLPWGPHEGNPVTFVEGLRDFARAIERAHGIGASTKESKK